jgi:mannose-6-phosphate isomerase-like protein (cupin superfamily)
MHGRKFDLLSEQWAPKVIAEMNDYQFKIVKLQGDFVWHSHDNTDETFIVIDGELRIDLRDRAVELAAGELYVVPKRIEHKPYAKTRSAVTAHRASRGHQYRGCRRRVHRTQ